MSEPKLVVVVRKELSMRKGKIAAQAAHAAQYFIFDKLTWNNNRVSAEFTKVEREWIKSSHAKVVVSSDSEAEFHQLVQQAKRSGITVHTVTDAGRTEFHGVPTITCAAFGPDYPEKLDPITGHLKLL